jgi:fucose permease
MWGWRAGLGLAACAPIVLFIFFGKTAPPPGASSQYGKKSTGQPLSVLFWVYWLAIVLAVSVEFCMISWSSAFVETILGLQKASAAQAVSLFLAAMIIGRMAASRLVQRFPTLRLVNAFILLAGLGFLFFWKGGVIPLGLGGLFVTGLGVSGLYPLLVSLAIGSAGENTVQASARVTLASGSAILTLPLVLGRLADVFGIASAYGVVIPLLLALFLILFLARRSSLPQRLA